jgi:hypothetical protein
VAKTVWASPYNARQCPECKVWVYTADGPFAEGDRTKTVADANHWEREHPDAVSQEVRDCGMFSFPHFPYNTRIVEAVKEDTVPS